MYPPMEVGNEQVVLRPMNCPHHILVFASEPRTARDIPFRLAELGTSFRYERSGVVGGLSRVRQMTLNDGHVFCAAGDVEAEITSIMGLVTEAYRALAIPPPRLRLSRGGRGQSTPAKRPYGNAAKRCCAQPYVTFTSTSPRPKARPLFMARRSTSR